MLWQLLGFALGKKEKPGTNQEKLWMELLDHEPNLHLKYLPVLFLCFVSVYRPCIYPTLRWI